MATANSDHITEFQLGNDEKFAVIPLEVLVFALLDMVFVHVNSISTGEQNEFVFEEKRCPTDFSGKRGILPT
jgi:hypothetical protein